MTLKLDDADAHEVSEKDSDDCYISDIANDAHRPMRKRYITDY